MKKFLQDFKNIKKSRFGRVAFPESMDPRVLQAINELLHDGALDTIVVFLSRVELTDHAQRLGLEHIQAHSQHIRCVGEDLQITHEEIFAFLKESMKAKPLAENTVCELARSPLYQAGYLLAKGELDCVLAGVTHTTADVIRAALRTVGKAPGVNTLSGSFIMQRNEEVYLFADCGVTIEPSMEELVDITLASCKTWEAIPSLRKTPSHVAFLSFSTKGSAKHKLATKMIEAAQEVQKRAPDLMVDGELQFDAAIDPEVALRKAPGSPVAGKANVFIFPDLNAANIAYKLAQRLGGFHAYGPLLQGLNKPFSDLSRGASVRDIVECTYIQLLIALHSASS